MTDEEFKKEVNELVGMLYNLRRIRDRSRKQWLKAEIRNQLRILMKEE